MYKIIKLFGITLLVLSDFLFIFVKFTKVCCKIDIFQFFLLENQDQQPLSTQNLNKQLNIVQLSVLFPRNMYNYITIILVFKI